MRNEISERRPGLVKRPRRRYFPLGEELAVLTAHGGRCVYCLAPSQVKDHVIAVASGGDDDWRNLVPACDPCNERKGNRTVAQFAAYQLTERQPQGYYRFGQLTDESDHLRRMLALWSERIEITCVELLHQRRLDWFRSHFVSTHFNARTTPTIRVKAILCRSFFAGHIAAAEAAGWPTESRAPFRILQPRQWHEPLSDDPDDWRNL
ncbi:HNH endonuclease [Streptomyces sp. NPDC051041]|uniref:HNH endonuclease n=1 Tax=Streptomyces sp. NPDC051041 TaxID=3365640 RepID=UPI00378F05A6